MGGGIDRRIDLFYREAAQRAVMGRIAGIVSPGFCTGVGGMPPDESAPQMRAAYDMNVPGIWRRVVHPVQAPFALAPPHATRPAR